MKALTILFLLFSISLSYGQTTIRGSITDSEDNSLPGVNIYLLDTEFQTYSDLKGKYNMYNVPSGDYKMVISYIGFADQSLDISVGNEKNILFDVKMEEGTILEEVVINGRLLGQARALNERKNRSNISEIVDAKQIERFPDANIGDALKRLSSINVQYDQGEARFANIRGTAPELNSITINGERIPSAEAEQRFVQLDLIPSDMVETIELNKAVTPDLDGDAIGGSVNLVTQKAKGGQKIIGKLGSGYSFLTQKPLYKGKLTYSNRIADGKLGIIANASILDKFIRSDNVEAEWDYLDENNKDGSVVPTDIQVRQYHLQRLRQSYSAALDYDLNSNHNIYIEGMYNWRNDWENRYRFRMRDIEQDDNGNYTTEIRRQTKGGNSDNKFARLEDQRMQSLRLGGNHFVGKAKINWSFAQMQASEDRPNERYISMRNRDIPVQINISDLRKPNLEFSDQADMDLSSNYGLREITEEFQYTEEEDQTGRFDVEMPLFFGDNFGNLKFGAKLKSKKKFRDNSFREYAPNDEDGFTAQALSNIEDQTLTDFSVGDYQAGNFVTREFLGELNLESGFEGEDVLEEFAGNFNAEEEVLAAYAMYSQELSSKFDFIVGARFEQTNVDYSGKIFDGETLQDSGNESEDYSNFLPGVHMNFRPNNRFNVRAAWTNTIARPNYFDLVPYQEINTEDNEISIGNPALEATTSMNVDLMAELFFDNVGVVSAGLFYKDLTNVIANNTVNDFTFNDVLYEQFTQPLNIGNASLLGIEVGISRRLDFLPGFLNNLSFYGNYTYNKSELNEVTLEDREDETLPLVGTPEHVTNLSLAYDTKKFDIRVSFNTATSFIEEYGDEAFYDRWYDTVNYLDINADYKVNSTWKVYFSVNNLLDQPLRYYQGVADRTMQVEFYGVQVKGGVKFEF